MGNWKATQKYFCMLIILQCIFVWMTPPLASAAGTSATLDQGLEAAIRQELALNGSTPITGNEIRLLTRLDASNRNILSLQGLENAVFLEELSLAGDYVMDYSILTQLPNLKSLTVDLDSTFLDQASLLQLAKDGVDVNLLEEDTVVEVPPIQVFYNKEPVSFSKDPVIVSNYTLVQFRPLFETFGLKIAWDQATQTVTGSREKLHIKMVIGSTTATVNDIDFTLPVAPQLIDGNTMIPLRFIVEVTGNIVNWDGTARTVNIDSSLASHNLDILYSNDTSYEGDMTAGIPNGNGKLYDNGTLFYEGEFKNGIIAGSGTMYDVNNPASYYEGDFQNNRFHGEGKLVYDDGAYHIGSFANGMREGSGKVYTKDGKLVFEGTFKNDGRNGNGWGLYGDGYKYEGMYANDQFHGQGKLFYQGQLTYSGEWNNGFKARGKTYINNVLFYEGTYLDDKPHGYGTFYDDHGNAAYRGQVNNWSKTGIGMIYYDNGDIYVGEVLFGKADGQGILSLADGNIKHDGFFLEDAAIPIPDETASDDKATRNRLMRKAKLGIVDGMYENNIGLVANQAAMLIILESKAQADLFNALSDHSKKGLMNEYVQEHWGEVIGVNECITLVVFEDQVIAETKISYAMENSDVDATYYPNGIQIFELIKQRHSWN